MRLPKSERFTDDCKKCGWCPEKENSTVPLGDCGLCFDCMDNFVETAVSHGGMDGCSTGDCPHEREADCVASQGEIVAEQAALLDARAGRIQRQNKMLVEKDARIAELEAVVRRLHRALSAARSDIFQTARSNQCNLTGKDIISPDDRPIPERIGHTAVHQRGIDESLALVDQIDATLASTEAAEARVADLGAMLDGAFVPVKWSPPPSVDNEQRGPYIELMLSPFYDGTRYAVRDGGGGCLSRAGVWEHEPIPSSRDDAFYARCRFESFAEAAAAAQKSAEEARHR